MKVLITGCNGFVARNVIRELSHQYDFIGIGRAERAVMQGIPYIQTDISCRTKLFEKIKEQYSNIDIMIHAAAVGNDVERLYQVNCLGTQNMVDLANELNCKKFIYISSIPVIGFPTQIPITESHSVNPLTIYHYTKYFGELIVMQLKKENIPYLTYRIPSPVGRDMPNNKIFSTFVRKSKYNETIEIYGNGKRVQNYLDVRDLSYAIDQGMKSNCQGIYNIVGNSISDYDLAKCCDAFYHRNNEIQIYNQISSDEKWIISGDKAKSDFDYEPRYSIKDSVEYVASGL